MNYIQREEELLSSWWKEYAECSEGPRGQPSISSKASQHKEKSSPEKVQSDRLYSIEEERVGVPVKGGLYEVLFLSVDLILIGSASWGIHMYFPIKNKEL